VPVARRGAGRLLEHLGRIEQPAPVLLALHTRDHEPLNLCRALEELVGLRSAALASAISQPRAHFNRWATAQDRMESGADFPRISPVLTTESRPKAAAYPIKDGQ
jgi:hypothetical protein